MSEWKPFETAPKDGTHILAFDADDGGGVSMGVVFAYWVDADEDEGWDEGWIVKDIGLGDELEGCNLTHWMPIPAGPNIN